jgi:ATP:cob(I)alamin adenosyltransferase
MSTKFKPQPSTDTISVASDITRQSTESRPTSVQNTPRKDTSTLLYNGEVVAKSDKILSVIGTLEELSAYIGIIKAEHFEPNIEEEKFDIDSSAKLFLYARLTQIQESILDIEASLGTSRKIVAKYEFTRFLADERVKILDKEIQLMSDVNLAQLKESMKEKPLQHIPGSSVIEAKLAYVRSLCRRAERQMSGFKNLQAESNCINYLNKLGDYFLTLSIHILHMQNKEPLKKVTRTNTRIIGQPNLK